MLALTDPKPEAFFQGIAVLCLCNSDAVRHAKYAVRQPHHKAHWLLKREDVQARIAELKTERDRRDEAAATVTVLDVANADHEPASPEWIVAKHVRAYHIAEARADLTAINRTLVELMHIQGMYVERSGVTTKTDPLTVLTGTEITALRAAIGHRASGPVVTVDAVPAPSAAVLNGPATVTDDGDHA